MSEFISSLTQELAVNFNAVVEREHLDHLRGYLVSGRKVDIVVAEDLSDYETAFMLVHSGAHIALGHLNKRFRTLMEPRRGAEEQRRGMEETIIRVDPKSALEHRSADILVRAVLGGRIDQEWGRIVPSLGIDIENEVLMEDIRRKAVGLRGALGNTRIPLIGQDSW